MLNHMKNALVYSLEGLKAAFIEEKAFRLVLLQFVLVLALLWVYPMTKGQMALILLCAFICIIVELLNSAIENIVDLASPDWHILAKKAKDMGSAAQFVACVCLWVQIILLL